MEKASGQGEHGGRVTKAPGAQGRGSTKAGSRSPPGAQGRGSTEAGSQRPLEVRAGYREDWRAVIHGVAKRHD